MRINHINKEKSIISFKCISDLNCFTIYNNKLYMKLPQRWCEETDGTSPVCINAICIDNDYKEKGKYCYIPDDYKVHWVDAELTYED